LKNTQLVQNNQKILDRIIWKSTTAKEEVIDMPRGDRTGPRGQGPGTGRSMGRAGTGDAEEVVSRQVLADTASAQTVTKEFSTNWEFPALRGDALGAEPS
jgi:hypothetical protein